MQRNVILRTALGHLQAGRFAEAAAATATLAADGADLDAMLLHGLALGGLGQAEAAAPVLAAVARQRPAHDHPVADLLRLLPPDHAERHIRAGLAAAPGEPRLLALLGTALAEAGSPDAAVDAFRTVAAARPDDAAAHANLGKALAACGRFTEAEACFAASQRLAPRDAQLGLNRAVALLKSGRWAEGWPAFQIRHALPGRPPPLPGPRLARLDGLAGRTLLLRHEEGLGDTLQFIRFAVLLAECGATVLAAVPPALQRLVARVPGVSGIAAGPVLPRYDLWCPIPDLPGLFGTTPDTVPAPIPYVFADRPAPPLPPGRRIGVVWAGAARAGNPAAMAVDRVRSMPPNLLAPLAELPGTVLVSLQLGVEPPGFMVDGLRGVSDMAGTAAVVSGLDAVVSVDTSVAHLAGAMGKPVLLMDRYDNCWRWLHGRTSTPWYPTMRIVRQQRPGDWNGVVTAVAARLR